MTFLRLSIDIGPPLAYRHYRKHRSVPPRLCARGLQRLNETFDGWSGGGNVAGATEFAGCGWPWARARGCVGVVGYAGRDCHVARRDTIDDRVAAIKCGHQVTTATSVAPRTASPRRAKQRWRRSLRAGAEARGLRSLRQSSSSPWLGRDANRIVPLWPMPAKRRATGMKPTLRTLEF
jgi:hypothetical protein